MDKGRKGRIGMVYCGLCVVKLCDVTEMCPDIWKR
jgi:hypothetical protein